MRAMIGVAGALLAMMVLTVGAQAAQRPKYEFRQNYSAGDRFLVILNTSINMDVSAKSAGQVIARTSGREATATKLTVTIVEAEGGVPTVEKTEFDPACAAVVKKPNANAEQMVKAPFAGRAVTLRREHDGSMSHDFDGGVNPAVLEQFRSLLDRDTDYYPPGPVSVGERWDIGPKLSRRMSTFARGNVNGFATLRSVKQVNGNRIAEIWITIAAMGVKEGMGVAVSLEGPAQFDLQTGRMMKVDLKGEIEAAGGRDSTMRNGRAVKLSGVGQGTLTYHQASRLMPAVVAAAPAPAPAAAVSTVEKKTKAKGKAAAAKPEAAKVQTVAMKAESPAHPAGCPCPCKHK